MSRDSKPTESSVKTTGQTATPTTESESVMRLRSLTTTAGPKHPIYSSGLTMTSAPASKPSTETSPSATGGTTPTPNTQES